MRRNDYRGQEKRQRLQRIGEGERNIQGESNTEIMEDGEKNAEETKKKKMYRGYKEKGIQRIEDTVIQMKKRRRKEFRGPKQKVIEEKQEKKTCFNRKSERTI
jgi:hypothetical protein